MNIQETNEEMFFDKIKNAIKEVLSSCSMIKKEEDIEPTNIDLEAEKPQETVAEEPKVEEPKVEEPVVEEPKVEEPKEEPKPAEEPKVEEPKTDTHLEELVNSLKEEINALKDMNTNLQKKIKDLGKQPSTEPVKPNAKPNAASTYSAWREQMRSMIG